MRKHITLLLFALLPFFTVHSIAKSNKEERKLVAERIDSIVHSGNWCILVDRYNRTADLYYDQLTPERNFVSVDNGVLTRCLDLAGARKNSNGSKYARTEEARREQPDYQMRSPIVAGGVQFEKPITQVKTLVSKDYKHMKIKLEFQDADPLIITVSIPSCRATISPAFSVVSLFNWQGKFII